MMFKRFKFPLLAVAVCATLTAASAPARAESEQEALETLRNTVTNLLQALVDQGLLTRDKAQALVQQAQARAAKSTADKAAADEGAVRVPYVPEIVKDEIVKRAAKDVETRAVNDVVERAKVEGWGVPGALPGWVRRTTVFGDVTLRMQSDLYARDNAQGALLDFNSINAAGGIGKAGFNAFLNVTEDRQRLRLRARLGLLTRVTDEVTAGIRLASGSLTDPGSESQTFGNYSARYTVGIDQAYIRWDPRTHQGFNYLTVMGGRIPNPWFAPTELVYARDLVLDGAVATGRLGLGDGSAEQSNLYLTAGAQPIQDVPLNNPASKWMIGGQFGANLKFGAGQSLRVAVAYYDYFHISGRKNDPDSVVYNYTAPGFLRTGNTVFDISNSTTDPTVNLFALAARFRLLDLAGRYELPVGTRVLTLTGEAVKNVGANAGDMQRRTGFDLAVRNRGYVGEVGFGDPMTAAWGRWRAAVGYRYVQADAVLDAWTDADFREGGTNVKGYYFAGELGLTRDVWARLRYLSGNEIDGPRYGLDLIQLDVNTRF